MSDLRARRRHVASLAVLASVVSFATVARADSAPPSPNPFATLAPADCRIVDATEAARVLGYPVNEADGGSARGGVCFYSTRAVSQEGSLSYAIVRAPQLLQRRAFFIAATRRCGSVAKGAPNDLICRSYRRLAEATDLESYFKARTEYPDSVPVRDLGLAAIAAPDAIYIRRGDTVFECVVRRGELLDVARTTELARLLLDRVPSP